MKKHALIRPHVLLLSFLLAGPLLAANQAAAECNSKALGKPWGDLDRFSQETNLGDVAIGTAYKGGTPRRFPALGESGCYLVPSNLLGGSSLTRFWINHVGDWSNAGNGTFVSIHATTVMQSAEPQRARYIRNDNVPSRSTYWYRQNADGSYSPANKGINTEKDNETLYNANSPEALERAAPGFDAYAVQKNDIAPSDDNRIWTLFAKTRPTADETKTLGDFGLVMRHRYFALAFDGREKNAGSGTLVPFELVTRGACVFIDIDSPLEYFERRYILQMEDSPIDCTDLKNRANSVKLSRTQETKRPNLLASLFSWAN